MLRAAVLLAALLTLLLTACSGTTDTTSPMANDSATMSPGTPDTTGTPGTIDPTSVPTSATPSATTTGGETGRTLTISAWNLTVTVPDTIPSGDVTIQDHTFDGGEGFVNLRSATLEDALDTDACGGSSVEDGQFAQIGRDDDESPDADGNVAVGEHVYSVRVRTNLAICYPDDLVQRYLNKDVGNAIRESLTAS